MIEIFAGMVSIAIAGLSVWVLFRTPMLPPHALFLFNLLDEIGTTMASDQQKDDKKVETVTT